MLNEGRSNTRLRHNFFNCPHSVLEIDKDSEHAEEEEMFKKSYFEEVEVGVGIPAVNGNLDRTEYNWNIP